MNDQYEVKIAYIGGGSRAWAPKLMSDLALSGRLTGEMDLYDIDHKAAEANLKVADMIFGHPDAKAKFKVNAVRKPSRALKGADFVVLSIEPGPIEMRYADLEIPARYGILQTVGDTTGPGGLLRSLRAVPTYEKYAHEIAKHCPNAWVINYTNPMTVCTAALYAAEPDIKAFGCCHEVFGTQEELSRRVAKWFDTREPDRGEIRLDISGVNHFTFATAAEWSGHDLMERIREQMAEEGFFRDRTEAALDRKREEKWFTSDAQIACDFLRRFGALGAAGDRHLAEFVPWYLTSEEDLHRWGVILTPYSYRLKRSQSLSQRSPEDPLDASGEEGVAQMLALIGGKPLVTNVNIPNAGQIPSLPHGRIVETYAEISHDRIRPIVSRPLPDMLQSIVRKISDTQQVTLTAALESDVDLAFQALLADPLVRIHTNRAWEMFREMRAYAHEHLDACLG